MGLLQTAYVTVFHNHERCEVQNLLVNGYQISFSLPDMRDKLQLPKKDKIEISMKILGSQVDKEKIDIIEVNLEWRNQPPYLKNKVTCK